MWITSKLMKKYIEIENQKDSVTISTFLCYGKNNVIRGMWEYLYYGIYLVGKSNNYHIEDYMQDTILLKVWERQIVMEDYFAMIDE